MRASGFEPSWEESFCVCAIVGARRREGKLELMLEPVDLAAVIGADA